MAPRLVVVSPERLPKWLQGFADRHGAVTWDLTESALALTAADGAQARCELPFPPLDETADDPTADFLRHVTTERRVGVLLVRLGGYAAGVFAGRTLESSKVGSRHVQGRTAAGGQSQQRFARRRQGQARVAYAAAADTAAAQLLPALADLDAIVLGGDKRAVGLVLDDPRLAPLRPLVTGPVLDVPDPRLRVLEATADVFRSVRFHVAEPESD